MGVLVYKYKVGYQDASLDFSRVEVRGFNETEQVIFGNYTDETCKLADYLYERYLEMAKYFAMFVTSLILLFLMLCCCGCLTCIKWRKNKRKDNFFGQNNGEDCLDIDHFWQEESSEEVTQPTPEPLYINVRDPLLMKNPKLKQ